VVGENIEYAKEEAIHSWEEECLSAMGVAKEQYGTRFVAASCGSSDNVSQWSNIDYYQYGSTLRLWIRPL
jgi:hypothetical protein